VPDRREPEASADRDASLESGELVVAQDRDVDLVGGVGSRPEDDPAQELGEHLVDQPQRRRRIMPGRLPRTKGSLRAVRAFSGTHRRGGPRVSRSPSRLLTTVATASELSSGQRRFDHLNSI
jgi:hypothetical protein